MVSLSKPDDDQRPEADMSETSAPGTQDSVSVVLTLDVTTSADEDRAHLPVWAHGTTQDTRHAYQLFARIQEGCRDSGTVLSRPFYSAGTTARI